MPSDAQGDSPPCGPAIHSPSNNELQNGSTGASDVNRFGGKAMDAPSSRYYRIDPAEQSGTPAQPVDPVVHLIDDDPEIRTALGRVLVQEGIRVREYDSPTDLLAAFDPHLPGCLVIDLELPEMSGLELHQRLVSRGCQSPFLIISGHGEVPDACEAFRKGAVDFISKPFTWDFFVGRVREALRKDHQSRVQRQRREDVARRIDRLTDREREVLNLVLQGRLTKQIARELNIAIKTVESHRSNITKKLGYESVLKMVSVLSQHDRIAG